MRLGALEARAARRQELGRAAVLAVEAVGEEWVQARFMQDVLGDARAVYWLHRAHQLEQSRPVPGDHVGQADRTELSARWHRLTEAAVACRNMARRALREHLEPADVLADAEAELRAAIDAGDPLRIHLAAGLVDWLTAPAWQPPPITETTEALIARHCRVIAAVDRHLAVAARWEAA